MNSFAEELESWNGKDTSVLLKFYQAAASNELFCSKLLALIENESYSDAATWLLYHHLGEGHEFRKKERIAFFEKLAYSSNWQTNLHLLQMLQFVPLDERFVDEIEQMLRQSIFSKKPFVRAWAYYGFALLTEVAPEFRIEVRELFDTVYDSETASAKVRIRKARQLMGEQGRPPAV